MTGKEVAMLRDVVREVVEEVSKGEKDETMRMLDKIVRAQETFSQEMTLLNGSVRRLERWIDLLDKSITDSKQTLTFRIDKLEQKVGVL